jgi:hypothetical protein
MQTPPWKRVFSAYPNPVRTKLLTLRQLIFDTAKATESVEPTVALMRAPRAGSSQ